MIENLENEVWKNIENYEGLYQVSNLGRVKSVERVVIRKNSCPHFVKERLLQQAKTHKGYLFVGLCKNGKSKTLVVHRLVAKAFIPNPNNFSMINHKNEVKTDNTVENLEWCTAKYNNNYGTRKERLSESLKGRVCSNETKQKISKANKGRECSNETKQKLSKANKGRYNIKSSKPILQFTKGGDFVKEYPSIREAFRQLGEEICGSISAVCKGRKTSAYGYVWKYK